MMPSSEQLALREYYQEVFKKCETLDNNLQNVFTPYSLCEKIIDKVYNYCEPKGKNILVTNLEFAIILIERGIEPKYIYFLTDCETKTKFVKITGLAGIEVFLTSFNEINKWECENMKFDMFIMNPPYQAKTKDNNKGTTLWDKFVSTGFKYLNKEGFFAAVHPSGWRDNSQTFKEAHVVRDNNLLYLSVHDEQDGMLTFGTSTRYDWYVCQNAKYNGETLIEDEDGNHVAVNILNLPVIPNHSIKLVDKFIAKPGEEKVNLLYSRTAYGADKNNISKTKDGVYCYPVIYSVSTSGPIVFWSSTNLNGHYGIKKLIFNPNRPIASLLDKSGEYGMSQWCVGITGDDKYLKMVKKVFDNQKTNGFNDFMEACHLTDTIFNRRVFKEFRKDFWKDFV